MPANLHQSVEVEEAVKKRIQADSHLLPYAKYIRRRVQQSIKTEHRITGGQMDLSEFASGHEYFGMHFQNGHRVFREWAPNATAPYLKGSFSGWKSEKRFLLSKISPTGVWEIGLSPDTLNHKDEYRLEMHWPGGSGDRIPAWTRRVVQDSETSSFNAQIWQPHRPYEWKNSA